MTPLVLVLVAIGVFGLVCVGLTAIAEAGAHVIEANRRRDPLAPDRDRDDLRRALARTDRT